VEERPESEADADLELTPEELVAADEAMLLDLGGAEQLADLIADQSLGQGSSGAKSASDAGAEAVPAPPTHEDDTPPAS
jgi:hypothetical protein